MLIDLKAVNFGYDDRQILQNITFTINEGERIGLIGGNGEGKTTLIRLILGELDRDSGELAQKNGIVIGYLEQKGGYESGNTVYQEMLQVFEERIKAVERYTELSQKIAEVEYNSAEYVRLSAKMESLNKYISANDCYNVEVKIRRVLNGMGFENNYNQVIDSMSGGEKTRLKLARLLLEEPDLLILDEPTNHLDIKTLFWLEDYLSTYKGAIFLVSHDRYFLDKIVTRIIELENKKCNSFSGNYTKYKVLKAQQIERLWKEYEKQQEEIVKLQTYVDKNIVRATTAKSALSRVKQLERMEVLEKPYTPPAPPKFQFTYQISPYERVLTIQDLHLSAGEKTLIQGGNLTLLRGEKVAVVGENGTGKSTLIKAIVQGHAGIELGRYVNLAYYDQENANLNGENNVLAELWERHNLLSQTEVRAALARAGLVAEDMEKKVKSLSGGERAKLALCVFENEHGNVLVLDEPTNHLDLQAREALEEGLKQFEGTIIFVSHDRYFISAIAGKVVELCDGNMQVYEGSYQDYQVSKQRENERKLQLQQQAEEQAYREKKASSYRSQKERAQEEKRKNRCKQIEKQIAKLEEEEGQINEQLALPSVTADFQKLTELCNRLEQLKQEADSLYEEYETLI